MVLSKDVIYRLHFCCYVNDVWSKRPYPAHVLISFWCDSDNKKFGNIALDTPARITEILAVCIWALKKLPGNLLGIFQPCHSLELELLHGFVSCLVQRRKPYPGRVLIVCGVIIIIKTYIFYVLGS